MAAIIEQENVDALLGNSLVAFQTSDLKALAAKILRRADEVAQQKIAAASQTAAAQEKKAYETGLAKGMADGEKKGEASGRAAGEKAAREEFVKATSTVSAALKASLAELTRRKMQLQADAEADMLHLAMAIAERIVRHEMSVNVGAVLPVVHEAISLCNDRSDLTLKLNPADVEAVEKEIPNLQGIFTDMARVDLRPDPAVERGGVLLQNRSNAVDLQLARQFAALERALAGSDDNPFDHLPAVGAEGLTAEEAEIAGSGAPVGESAARAETPPAPDSPAPAAPVAGDAAGDEPAVAGPSVRPGAVPADSAAPSAQPAAAPEVSARAAAPVSAGGLSALRSVKDLATDAADEAAIAAALRGSAD